jgi:hypothetical protein
MTRAASSRLVLAALVALLGLGAPVPAVVSAATTTCGDPGGGVLTHMAIGDAPKTLTGNLDATRYVCLSGAAAHTAVLDVTASAPAGTDLLLCVTGIPDPANPTTSTTGSGRSSHVAGSQSQRVAFSSPRYTEYAIALHSVGTGGVQEPCFASPGASAPFTMTIRYYDSPPATAGNGFSFDTQHLPRSNPSLSDPGGGEPSIVVDRLHGDRVYISTPVGVLAGPTCLEELNPDPNQHICNGTNFWFSLDRGKTFTFCNASTPNGGGDSALALDTTGSIYGADLAASNLQPQKLSSTAPNAPPTPARGSDGNCNITNTAPAGPAADRQWLATYLPDPSMGTGAAKVYLSYNSLGSGTPLECIGVNGGQAFPACTSIVTDPVVAADAASNAVNGNQVVDSKGNAYSVFSTSTVLGNVNPKQGDQHNIYIGRSTDGNGATFTDLPVYISQPAGSADTANSVNIYRLFPVIAIDRADNLYVVWPETRISTGQTVVKMTSSTNHGDTWSEPTVVNTPDLKSNVLPWVVAGDDGKVDVAWIGSTVTTLTNPIAEWNVYLAQTTNGHGKPRFTQARVSPQPVRYGAICFRGTFCLSDGDEGRILLDFMTIDLDSRGLANITYANAGPDTEGFSIISGIQPFTDYAHQVAGVSICSSGCTPPGYHPTAAVPLTGPGMPATSVARLPWRAATALPGLALAALLLVLGAGGRLLVRARRRS